MIIPFINLSGQASDAISFYESVFDICDKQVMYFKDSSNPGHAMPEYMDNYVLHAEMTMNGTRVWIGDTPSEVASGDMVSLAVNLASEADMYHVFIRLKTGGKVLMNLSSQFYSPLSGMVEDKFGVIWYLIYQGDESSV